MKSQYDIVEQNMLQNFAEANIVLLFFFFTLTPLHSERPKLYAILAFLSVIGLVANVSVFYAFGVFVHVNFSHPIIYT